VIQPYNCTDPNLCTDSVCVAVAGVASCNTTAVSCASFATPDECTPVTCEPTVGCTTLASKCDDGNPCTVDTCVGPNNCTNIVPDNVCGEPDACQNVMCDSTKATLADACTSGTTNITCTAPNLCMVVAGCNSSTGCVFAPKTCPTPAEYCLTSVCDTSVGCVQVPRVCGVNDANCYTGVCSNVTASCSTVKRSGFNTLTTNQHGGGTCLAVYDKSVVAGITAGATAGVVVAAVAVAALVGFGGKKGYDYLMAKNSPIGDVGNNPLYAPGSGSGQNALYRS